MGKISDADAYQQGVIYAQQVDSVVFNDGEKLPMVEAMNAASRSSEILFTDKYDRGRFVAGVRGYYKERHE